MFNKLFESCRRVAVVCGAFGQPTAFPGGNIVEFQPVQEPVKVQEIPEVQVIERIQNGLRSRSGTFLFFRSWKRQSRWFKLFLKSVFNTALWSGWSTLLCHGLRMGLLSVCESAPLNTEQIENIPVPQNAVVAVIEHVVDDVRNKVQQLLLMLSEFGCTLKPPRRPLVLFLPWTNWCCLPSGRLSLYLIHGKPSQRRKIIPMHRILEDAEGQV